MRWISLPALLLLAIQVFGAEQAAPTRIGFPWFIAPKQAAVTVSLPDAERLWRRDAVREERKEREHWARLREADERRIRDRYRIETETALQRAVAAADARFALKQNTAGKTGMFSRDRSPADGDVPREAAGGKAATKQGEIPGGDLPPRSQTADKRTSVEKFGAVVKGALDDAVGKIDNAADALAPSSAGRPQGSGVVFFLLLLALFLVPAFAVALLLLAFIHLRNGHRLQSAVFGAAGVAVAALVVATAHDMRAEDPRNQQAETERLRAECGSSAVSLTGYIYDVTPEGTVLSNAEGAQADEFGWVVVVTKKRFARSGNKLKLLAYPVGVRKIPNAFGLIRDIPAYADTLETAVALRAEAERMASEWWWQRLTRSMRET